MRKHRSFCLPESEQASRQARQEPDGVMVRREMTVFPALARMVESRQNSNVLGRGSRAGGRGLGDGVEGLERFRLTRQYWLGRLRGNPAAAAQELKPLERIGPAQMERSVNVAIPLCESAADGVE